MHCCPGIGQVELCTQVGLDVRLCGRSTVVSDDDVSLHSVAAIHSSKTKICTAFDKKPSISLTAKKKLQNLFDQSKRLIGSTHVFEPHF
jgi:hypothetical protein